MLTFSGIFFITRKKIENEIAKCQKLVFYEKRLNLNPW